MVFCELFGMTTTAIDVKKMSHSFSRLKVSHGTLSVVFAEMVFLQRLGPGVAFSLRFKEKCPSVPGFSVRYIDNHWLPKHFQITSKMLWII